jgi:hypothetical protein
MDRARAYFTPARVAQAVRRNYTHEGTKPLAETWSGNFLMPVVLVNNELHCARLLASFGTNVQSALRRDDVRFDSIRIAVATAEEADTRILVTISLEPDAYTQAEIDS